MANFWEGGMEATQGSQPQQNLKENKMVHLGRKLIGSKAINPLFPGDFLSAVQ